MLKRFTVENFSSYQDENCLDLTAGRTEFHQNHIVDFPKVKILKSALVYGANASGKSNLIKAIDYAKSIIIKSLKSKDIDTHQKYFRLDNLSSKKATSFEFEFELNDKFFSYGFSLMLEEVKITEEWLFEIGKTTPEKIFERKNNEIVLGKILKNKSIKELKNIIETYAYGMKNQSHKLFLSEISNKQLDIKDVEILNDIFKWFDEKLILVYPNSQFAGISLIGNNTNLDTVFKKYLYEFDTGIIDISSIEEDFDKVLKNDLKIKKDITNDFLKKETKNIILLDKNKEIALTIYKNKDNELKVRKLGLIHNIEVDDIFELKDESDGTKRLFDLIPLLEHFSQDFTIIIDEFDRSLHPKLARKFLELFYNIENSKSQLIVTTHESSLLDLDLLRRDEIWFAEKNKHGASKLFTLNQFKVRYDSKIEKAYLLGRYGAIPIFKTFHEIELDN